MASLNKVMLIGRLTKDPEPPRVLQPSGNTVVKFGFAVGRSKKNPQTGQWENDPNPLFLDCEVFTRPDAVRNLCDVISRYTRKGSQLYLEGRLQLDTWEDKNGGGKRSKHKLVVDSVELLDKAGDNPGGGGEDGAPARSNYGGGAPARGPAKTQGGGGYTPPDDFDDGPKDGDNIPF